MNGRILPGIAKLTRLALPILIFLAAGPPLAAQQALPGMEARTPHFRVITTGPGPIAATAAGALERAYAQFAALGFAVSRTVTEVILFPTGQELQAYAPGRGVGFFRPGAERSFIVVALDAAADPLKPLAHEFAHQAALPYVAGRPLCLREGLAELLSNLEPVAGGLRLGTPIASHLAVLKRGPGLDWEQLRAIPSESAIFQDPKTSAQFYAQGWLLAHSLVVGVKPELPLPARVASLEFPSRPPECVPEKMPSEILTTAGSSASLPEPAVRVIQSWEWEHRLADLARAMNRADQAREALLSLRSRFPHRPEPAESLGAMEMEAFHYDQAGRWLAEAVQLGSANANTHYRYSLLLMRPEGDPEQAARHARRAVKLDPEEPLYWLAQAQADMQLSSWDTARASLAQMRDRTTDPLLLDQVRVELAEVERRREQQSRPAPRPAPPAKFEAAAADPEAPPVAPPPARPLAPSPRRVQWPPPGTILFWGYLRRVECGEDEKILTVTNTRFSVRVRERAGAPAKLYPARAGRRRNLCSLKDVEVNVVYRPLANFGPLNGDLVAVLF